MRREKVEVDFLTFLSPEATKSVCKYIKWRNQKPNFRGEIKNQIHNKRKIYTNDDFLFIKNDVPDEYLQDYDEKIRKLNLMGLTDVYRSLAKKSGQSTPLGKWQILRSHKMRAWFNSTLINAGADSFFVEYLMGHSIEESREVYFRANKEKMKERYMKYVPFLTIQKELDVSESPEYKQMKKENEYLQRETVKHVVERGDLKEVWKALEEEKEKRRKIEESKKAIDDMLKKLKDFNLFDKDGI